jgi:glutamate 5-kinase
MDSNKLFVIKVGSRLIADHSEYGLPFIAQQIEQLVSQGCKVVLISSGAVELGRQQMLNFVGKRGISSLKYKSLLAAVGQVEVVSCWSRLLKFKVGQVLVERDDLSDRQHFLKTAQLISQMLSHQVVPIVNENDSLNYGRRCLGNNDLLAAHMASMLGASWLVLLTDTPYIYRDFPVCEQPVYRLSVRDESLDVLCKGSISGIGTGGMATKLAAARLAARKGVNTLIGGGQLSILEAIQPEAKSATQLLADLDEYGQSFQVWLSEISEARATLYIDEGAMHALLKRQASLLVPGVVQFFGVFNAKDVVNIALNSTGEILAKGVIRVSSNRLKELLGENKYPSRVGSSKSILVHRNDMVLLKKAVNA